MKTLRILTMLVGLCLTGNLLAQSNSKDTAVYFNASLDNAYVCPDKKEVYLYVDLKGSSLGKRVPLNICVVYDRSMSMEGERMHNGKLAIEYLIDKLSPDDNLAIVIYDHEAEILHPMEPVYDKDALKRKVARIHPRGSTNIGAGLEHGFSQVATVLDTTKINRVFLLSDGYPTSGITDDYMLQRIVRNHCKPGMTSLSAFGIGHEFNQTLMHDLAEAGGGHYYYIEQPSDAYREFGQEVTTLQSVVAQNAFLKIEFNAQVLSVVKAYGYHYIINGNYLMIDLKEVHPNEKNGILITFRINSPATSGLNFKSTLSYNNSSTGMRIEKVISRSMTVSTDKDACYDQLDPEVMDKVYYYTSNDLLDSAIYEAENNHTEAAKDKARRSKAMLQASTQSGSSSQVQQQLAIIDQYQKDLQTWHLKSEEEKSKIHKRTHHQNYKLRKGK